MKKILIGIPCLMLGGSEIASLQMVSALVANGYTVQVIVYYESDPAMTARYRDCGAKVVSLNERRGGASGMLRLLLRLIKLFRNERPSAVHVQYFSPGMIPILAARLAGVRTVFATIHAAGGNGYGRKAKMMLRISAALTTHFFCVAENTERFWFGSVGGKRHSTLHNGIDVKRFAEGSPVKIAGIEPRKDLVIGIVGRVVRLKGHDCLLRAVKQLLPEFPDLKILIVGDGDYRSELEKLSHELELESRIVWSGRIEPEALPGYYKNMNILAMPSHWEGFGLTAAEAMASGVPVIASDVPGLREVVDDTGILFPVNDDCAMATGIKAILRNPALYSKQAFQRVNSLFSMSEQQKKWTSAYRDML